MFHIGINYYSFLFQFSSYYAILLLLVISKWLAAAFTRFSFSASQLSSFSQEGVVKLGSRFSSLLPLWRHFISLLFTLQ
jgi:hypothetical protein